MAKVKIDVTAIPGYAEMSDADKIKALEAFEYEDMSADYERMKNAVSKANSEAAGWKKKHNELLTDDERKAQEQAERFADMEKELTELRTAKVVSEYKAKFIGIGYDEKSAEETAKAMASGDTATVFTNHQKFVTDLEKKIKADSLKGTPKPAPGSGGEGGVDYAKKIEEYRTRGDYAAVAYYTRLQAESEAAGTGD